MPRNIWDIPYLIPNSVLTPEYHTLLHSTGGDAGNMKKFKDLIEANGWEIYEQLPLYPIHATITCTYFWENQGDFS